MPEGALESELREAIEDLEAYLSDLVAPLLVIDSVTVLLRQQPSLGAEVIRAWIGAQLRAPGSHVGLEDYLYHAVKKLQLLGRLKLVEEEPLNAWIREVAELLLAQVPEAQRGGMRTLLEQASAGEASLASTTQVLHRPVVGGVGAPVEGASAGITAEVAASMRQFAMLLSRFSGEGKHGTGELRLDSAELAPQLLAAAAESARSQGELDQYLASLSRAGLMTQVRMSDLFNTLSLGVPNWWVGGSESAAPAPESAPIQAMHRIVSLADPGHTRAHFRELLKTVAQQFNAHALPRAVQVLDVARRLLAEGKVDKTTADLILATAHEDLDATELMAQTQQTATLPLLRSLLGAYPALTPAGLLSMLDDEPDRARRRLWLALLEAHGPPARQAALDRLQQSIDEGEHGDLAAWRQRNFVYLLHRIRPPAGDDARREIALVARCCELGTIAPLVREALIDLGLRRHPDAEAVLRQRLEQVERALETPGGPYEPPELRRMLSLVVAGLVRQGTAASRRAVADHGLKQKPHLGDTLERLGELGSLDLAEDPELVDRLLATLRGQLPMRLLGFNLRRHEAPQYLVRALHGTRSDAVHHAFSEIAQRFPEEPFGQAAAQVLANWDAPPAPPPTPDAGFAPPPPPVASLAGDLEAFGLPELLQTLMQTSSSGRLVLRKRAGGVAGEVLLREGGVREARVRGLPMPDAFYELLESPQPGTFEFVRQPASAVPAGTTHDIMGLLMEGMRRYDELQRARALAPDHAYLRPTGARPTAPPEESDGVFIRELWTRVKAGATPRQCEDALATDAYRIRALLAHWLTSGAVEIRDAVADVPP